MKTKYLILAAISLLFTCAKAQSYESIKLYEGTDSAVSIFVHSDDVWVYTKDSLIIMRKDLWDSNNIGETKKSRKKSKSSSLQEIKSYSGKITQWEHNTYYKVNGFYLETENETLLVRFNPNLAAKIKKLDEQVKVKGTISKHSTTKKKIIRMVEVQDIKDTVHSNPTIAVYKKISIDGNLISGSAKITQIKGKRKNIFTCTLDNHVRLNFCFFRETIALQELQTGMSIEYTGYEIPLQEGEIIDGENKVIFCKSLTINGNLYETNTTEWMIIESYNY